jgi:hypothetical protein
VLPRSYVVPGEGTSPKFGRAFARGCGGQVTPSAQLLPGPIALFGSPKRWALLQQAIAEGRDWYYGDHAFFGRGEFYRITKNAYQHDGSGNAGPERFDRFGRVVQPWRRSGSHVLVCPNSATYFGLFGLNVERWIGDVRRTLSAHTDREIRVRWKRDETPIAADLVDAWAVVAFSSVAALDALIAGVPVFVLAPFAAALRMGLSDLTRIESPVYPDGREPFLWNLAAQQWTLDEIAAGDAWRALQKEPCCAAA